MAEKLTQPDFGDEEVNLVKSRARASGDDKLPPKAKSRKMPWQKASSKKIGMTDRINPRYK
jgi:hypothetical protein